MQEIYNSIAEIEGYLFSNLGNVYSIKTNKNLRKYLNYKGYHFLGLRVNGVSKKYYIHRLVAMAFIPNQHNKPQVNHINGNKLDNRVENLEWVTNNENKQHAVKNKLTHKGRTTIMSKNKVVIDLYSGVFYYSTREAERHLQTKIKGFRHKLEGDKINKYKIC
jgi:hypothetical protein